MELISLLAHCYTFMRWKDAIFFWKDGGKTRGPESPISQLFWHFYHTWFARFHSDDANFIWWLDDFINGRAIKIVLKAKELQSPFSLNLKKSNTVIYDKKVLVMTKIPFNVVRRHLFEEKQFFLHRQDISITSCRFFWFCEVALCSSQVCHVCNLFPS